MSSMRRSGGAGCLSDAQVKGDAMSVGRFVESQDMKNYVQVN